MITKAQVKHIQSLQDKKNRDQHQQFVVEGEKSVAELLASQIEVETIYALPSWIEQHANKFPQIEIVILQPFELGKISSLKTPNKVLALAKIPSVKNAKSQLALVLDGIQDPGNMGSIIRIADWYNIPQIYCSELCADIYNTKVIQASMGSVFRISVEVCDLEKLVSTHPKIPTYACVLNGEDIANHKKLKEGFIIIGNESKGVSDILISMSTHKISIPRKGHAESLNAAVAAGIICHSLL